MTKVDLLEDVEARLAAQMESGLVSQSVGGSFGLKGSHITRLHRPLHRNKE